MTNDEGMTKSEAMDGGQGAAFDILENLKRPKE
jgi:hypothetical protein